jgi:hypothetical protein
MEFLMRFLLGILSLQFSCQEKEVEEDEVVDIQVRPDETGENEEIPEEELRDIDQDGFTEDIDCDDWNPNINPEAEEILNDEDDDCDGFVDIDGIHTGILNLEAVAIYQGTPYFFEQTCEGEVSRIEGQVQILVHCQVDQTQERANMLLGEEIVISGSENFIFEETCQTMVQFSSSGGEMEWDTQGEVSLSWSSFEENLGQEISVAIFLDALYLDINLQGLLTRQENGIE